MKIRILHGVSGYRADGSPYQYPPGAVTVETDFIVRDLLKCGLAEIYIEKEDFKRPIADPPRNYAVTPTMDRSKIVHAVIKRGRKPKRDV